MAAQETTHVTRVVDLWSKVACSQSPDEAMPNEERLTDGTTLPSCLASSIIMHGGACEVRQIDPTNKLEIRNVFKISSEVNLCFCSISGVCDSG